MVLISAVHALWYQEKSFLWASLSWTQEVCQTKYFRTSVLMHFTVSGNRKYNPSLVREWVPLAVVRVLSGDESQGVVAQLGRRPRHLGATTARVLHRPRLQVEVAPPALVAVPVQRLVPALSGLYRMLFQVWLWKALLKLFLFYLNKARELFSNKFTVLKS